MQKTYIDVKYITPPPSNGVHFDLKKKNESSENHRNTRRVIHNPRVENDVHGGIRSEQKNDVHRDIPAIHSRLAPTPVSYFI